VQDVVSAMRETSGSASKCKFHGSSDDTYSATFTANFIVPLNRLVIRV